MRIISKYAASALLGLGAVLVGTNYNVNPKEIQRSVRIERVLFIGFFVMIQVFAFVVN